MPFIDPANPSPWLASLSASRRRRAEAARQARRRRAGRGGGERPARGHDPRRRRRGRGRTGRRRPGKARASGSTRRRAPARARRVRRRRHRARHAPRDPQLPAQPGPRGRRHRRPGDARAASASPPAPAKTQTQSTARRGGSGTLARIARCESGGDPTAVSSSGQLPRQVPVLPRDLARPRRQRRPRCGARVRAGRDGGEAARPARHTPLAGMRELGRRSAQRQRSVSGSSRIRRMRAGWPALTELAGRSLVTTELVPITELSPTVAPRRMHAP